MERLSGAGDRRKVLVRVTPQAYEVVNQVFPTLPTASSEMFPALSAKERRALVELLGKAQRNLLDVAEHPRANHTATPLTIFADLVAGECRNTKKQGHWLSSSFNVWRGGAVRQGADRVAGRLRKTNG